MSQEQLRRMLGESAAGIEVGPPPAIGVSARGPGVRRVVAAVGVVAVVVGAGAIATRVGGDDTASTPATAPDGPILVALPADGEASMDAEITGRLGVDQRGCVVLDTVSGSFVALWPSGWSADVDGDALTLRGPDGVLARHGDHVSTGGGYGPQPDYRSWRCYPADGEVAVIQSEVEVAPPDGVPIETSDWRPGDGGRLALLSGRLTLDDECVRVGGSTVVWPAGFTAERDLEGRLVLIGPDGRPAAYEGQRISAGGGIGNRTGGPCADHKFSIQSELRVRP